MAQSILIPGTPESYSGEFTVTDGVNVVLSIYTDNGTDAVVGPCLILQRKDSLGNFISVETEKYSELILGTGLQQYQICTAGTYRVKRPNIEPWGQNIGIEISYYGKVTPTPSPVVCRNVPFDFAVLNLTWGEVNGIDLDPRVALTNPPRFVYVGWAKTPNDESFIKWAGDKQGNSGTESFLIDVTAIKNAYPNNNDINFDITGYWYTKKIDGNIKLDITTYTGGQMQDSGTEWINIGGTKSSQETKWVNCSTTILDVETNKAPQYGQDLANLNFSYCDGTFSIVPISVSVTPTPTASVTPSTTPTRTPPVTATITPTVSFSQTVTPTISRSSTPTRTPPRTPTMTPTISLSPSVTPTISRSATMTPTPTQTQSNTPTNTVTPTITPTVSFSATPTVTPSKTPRPTVTISVTPSISMSASNTPTPTRTQTVTPTVSFSATPRPTNTQTPTRTPFPSASVTPTITPTVSLSATVTPTVSLEVSKSATPQPTVSATPAPTSTMTPTPTISITPSITPSLGPILQECSSISGDNIGWNSITFGDDKFVGIAGYGSPYSIFNVVDPTSPASYTFYAMPGTSAQWESVAYGNGIYVAVASTGTGNKIATSVDGATWTRRASINDSYTWKRVRFINGKFVAIATNGGVSSIMSSVNGITWEAAVTPNLTITNADIAFGNGVYVGLMTNETTNTAHIITSIDSITWTELTTINAPLTSITFGDGNFVAVSSEGPQNVYVSNDNGNTWTAYNGIANTKGWNYVTYENGIFMAVSNQQVPNAMYSKNAINWITRDLNNPSFSNDWRSVAYGKGSWLFASYGTNSLFRVCGMALTPTPTPSFSPTATVTPSFSPTPTATPIVSATATPAVSNSPSPTPSTSFSPTPTPSPLANSSRRLMALAGNSGTEVYNVFNDSSFVKINNVPNVMNTHPAHFTKFVDDKLLFTAINQAPYMSLYRIHDTGATSITQASIPSLASNINGASMVSISPTKEYAAIGFDVTGKTNATMLQIYRINSEHSLSLVGSLQGTNTSINSIEWTLDSSKLLLGQQDVGTSLTDTIAIYSLNNSNPDNIILTPLSTLNVGYAMVTNIIRNPVLSDVFLIESRQKAPSTSSQLGVMKLNLTTGTVIQYNTAIISGTLGITSTSWSKDGMYCTYSSPTTPYTIYRYDYPNVTLISTGYTLPELNSTSQSSKWAENEVLYTSNVNVTSNYVITSRINGNISLVGTLTNAFGNVSQNATCIDITNNLNTVLPVTPTPTPSVTASVTPSANANALDEANSYEYSAYGGGTEDTTIIKRTMN